VEAAEIMADQAFGEPQAKTCQILYQMAAKLGLWKLLKSEQIVILASHRCSHPK
jgi:hypothetical protein